MNSKQTPKVIALRSLIAISCIGFGILITAQFRSIPARVSNPVAPYVSLKETRGELYTEQDQLRTEIKKLQDSIRQTQQENENNILTKDEIQSLNSQKNLAGLTKLNGSGVIIELDDSKKSSVSEDSIIHASDLRDTLNILWASGAEGIEINNQRIVVSTAIDCIVNTILINNVRITTPFRIEAVGNQQTMYNALKDRSVLVSLWSRVSGENITFTITKNNDITLPAFDGSFNINSASN